MTREELYRVRRLRETWREASQRLITLACGAINLTPKRDGQPHGTYPKSRVEELAVKMIDAERQANRLREEMKSSAEALTKQLQAEPIGEFARLLLIYRYVDCRSFTEIARLTHLPKLDILRRHDTLLDEILK